MPGRHFRPQLSLGVVLLAMAMFSVSLGFFRILAITPPRDATDHPVAFLTTGLVSFLLTGGGCGSLVGYILNRWDGALLAGVIGSVLSGFAFSLLLLVLAFFATLLFAVG